MELGHGLEPSLLFQDLGSGGFRLGLGELIGEGLGGRWLILVRPDLPAQSGSMASLGG